MVVKLSNITYTCLSLSLKFNCYKVLIEPMIPLENTSLKTEIVLTRISVLILMPMNTGMGSPEYFNSYLLNFLKPYR